MKKERLSEEKSCPKCGHGGSYTTGANWYVGPRYCEGEIRQRGQQGGTMKKYDGCTGFLDGYWVACCDEHDVFYEQGGNWRDRRFADQVFRRCVDNKVFKRTGSKPWAIYQSWAMYLGVRIMGSPWCLPLYLWPRWRNQARWGFGK